MRRRRPHPLSLALLLLAAAAPASPAQFGEASSPPSLAGVPLGGIGAGKIEIFEDGSLGEATFNHNWDDPLPLPGSLFAIRVETQQGALVRALRSSPVLGFEPVAEVRSERLFPRARLEYGGLPVEVELEAFSPFVPGDAATSGTPAAIFVFRVRNPSGAPARVSLLAAFENVLGCGGPRRKRVRDRTGNFVDGVARQGFAGVRFVTDRTFGDERRNHLGEYALLAQAPQGGSVSIRAYDAGGNGADLREDLAADGRLDGETGLRGLEGKVHPGGAACVLLEVPPGASRECAFAFAWHLPHFVTADGRDHPPAYTSRLASAADAAAVALRRRPEWLAAVREWQDLLLDSTLPGWLVSRICEGAAPLVSDTVWTADGVFGTLARPGDAGALGAIDRRLAAHALSFAFFPDLDREELRRFAASQRRDGEIPPSFGNLHEALDAPGSVEEGRSRPDPSCSFVLQVEKTYRWTGDRPFLEEMLPAARRALDWLATRDRDGDGIPEGGREPGTRAHEASLFLATLRAGEWIGRTVGDASLEKACADRFERARRSMIGELWNGRWFSESFDPASGRRSDACTPGQLAGDWFASLLLWEPLVPEPLLDRALDSMLRSGGALAFPPVPDLPRGRSLLASLGAARGRVREGLEILRPAGASLRAGEGPSPEGPDPAAGFVPYGLAGFALDFPDAALRLRPNLPDDRSSARLPIFAPNFLARLEVDAPRSSPGRCLRFEVLRRLREEPLRVDRIETEVPPLADGAEPTIRVLLDGRPEEAAVRRSGGRLVLRLARTALLEPGKLLEVHVAPPPGTIEVDAGTGGFRLLGTPITVERVEREERSLRLVLRNESTVDQTVRLRVLGWSAPAASLRPLAEVVTREQLEAGLTVPVPGRLLPARELDRLLEIARRIEQARSSNPGEIGRPAEDLLSAVGAWKTALLEAEATGRVEVPVEHPDQPTARPAAADRPPGSARDADRRASLRAEVRGPYERALPLARTALSLAPEGTADRSLLEALHEVRVDPVEAAEPGPGRPIPFEIVLRNESDRRAAVRLSLAAPAGGRIEPSGSADVGDLLPGDETRLRFALVPSEEGSVARRCSIEWSARLRVADVHTVRSGRFILGRAFLTRWRAVGPFENLADGGLSVPFPPESAVELEARFPVRGGEAGWREARVREGFVDLGETLGYGEPAVGYAVCWIRSPRTRDAFLEVGSGGGAKVWLRDQLVSESHEHRPASPSQVRVPVRLDPGWNRLLVKVEKSDREWGFYLELAGRDGEGFEDLEVRDEPPAGGR